MTERGEPLIGDAVLHLCSNRDNCLSKYVIGGNVERKYDKLILQQAPYLQAEISERRSPGIDQSFPAIKWCALKQFQFIESLKGGKSMLDINLGWPRIGDNGKGKGVRFIFLCANPTILSV